MEHSTIIPLHYKHACILHGSGLLLLVHMARVFLDSAGIWEDYKSVLIINKTLNL